MILARVSLHRRIVSAQNDSFKPPGGHADSAIRTPSHSQRCLRLRTQNVRGLRNDLSVHSGVADDDDRLATLSERITVDLLG